MSRSSARTAEQRSPETGQASWSGLIDKLVYVPGAVVLAYGFWLTLSV